MTEIQPYEGPPLAQTDTWVPILKQVGELAVGIAGTDFVPKALRGKTAAISACILLGRELGMSPMTSLTGIYVVDGHPTLAAATMRALVYAGGHRIHVDDWTDQRCTLTGQRRGDDEPTATVTYTLADAQRAGLSGRATWKTYPRNMLLARATSELCRAVFPDVIAGLGLADDTDEQPTTRTTIRRRPAQAAEPATAEPDPNHQANPQQEDPPPMITMPQLKKLQVMFRERGVRTREARLKYTAGLLGRDITSTSDLTRDEASDVIERLADWHPDGAA